MPELGHDVAASRICTAILGVCMVCAIPGRSAAQGSSVQALRIEPLPVDVELSAIGWALRANNGLIVFADAKARLVYVRDSAGTTQILGAQGEGPGEYRDPKVGFLKGDSVVIHESRLGRREAISLGTGIGESRLMVGTPLGTQCRIVILLSSTGLCEETTLGVPGTGMNTIIANWFRVDTTGYELRNIQSTPDTAYVARLVSAGGVLFVPRPYTWANRSGGSRNGKEFVTLGQVAVDGRARVTVSMWSVADGQVKRMKRIDPAKAVSSEERRGLVSRMVEDLGNFRPQLLTQRAEFATALRRGWSLGPLAPPYESIEVSDDHCVWLERTDIGVPDWGKTRVYDRWTFAGDRLPTVSIPRSVRLLSVDCGSALAYENDKDDVPELKLLQVP